MSAMNMPGFTAQASLDRKGTYYFARSGILNQSGVRPQAFRGGFGGGFGGAGLDPLPPACSRCTWTCTVVSCGPGCREERCGDVCVSIPCSIG
jgi:hypothetical protein